MIVYSTCDPVNDFSIYSYNIGMFPTLSCQVFSYLENGGVVKYWMMAEERFDIIEIENSYCMRAVCCHLSLNHPFSLTPYSIKRTSIRIHHSFDHR